MDEDAKPEEVEEAHGTEHYHRDKRNNNEHVKTRLEGFLRSSWSGLNKSKNVVNHVRKHYHTGVAPDHHIRDHAASSHIRVFSYAKEFSDRSGNICDIMEKRDGHTNWQSVGEAHAEQEGDCADMVHQHLKEITLSFF